MVELLATERNERGLSTGSCSIGGNDAESNLDIGRGLAAKIRLIR
jgi:hypothetical protein